MKVLVVGKGGREHSLCWRLNQSPTVWGLYCTGGSPGINQVAQPVAIAPEDFAGLANFAAGEKIDLTIVGSEAPLAGGIVDEFERAGLTIFGPSKAAAQLEASKAFAKLVMREANVPTADFATFDDADAARHYLRSIKRPCVVKADGLAMGKGVTVCDNADAALAETACLPRIVTVLRSSAMLRAPWRLVYATRTFVAYTSIRLEGLSSRWRTSRRRPLRPGWFPPEPGLRSRHRDSGRRSG